MSEGPVPAWSSSAGRSPVESDRPVRPRGKTGFVEPDRVCSEPGHVRDDRPSVHLDDAHVRWEVTRHPALRCTE